MRHHDLLINFATDLVATVLLTGFLFYRRHKRRDLFVTFTFFNIAMFVIVTLISSTQLSVGAGFGLFALLSIIRLRSEEFSNYEIGYFFGCLTLAIVNALARGSEHNQSFILILNAIVLLSIGLLDSPLFLRNARNTTVSLDAVYSSDEDLVKALEKLLQARVLKFNVSSINNVQDTTKVSVTYLKEPYKPAKKVITAQVEKASNKATTKSTKPVKKSTAKTSKKAQTK